MKRLIQAGLAVLVCAIAARAANAPSDAASVLALLEKTEKQIQTLSFDFRQTTVLKVTGETQALEGRAFFKRPDSFRVEHLRPRPQTVVSDGKSLWLHHPDRGHVFVDSWENWGRSSAFPQGLTPFRLDVAGLKDRYLIEYEGTEGENAVLRLTPRRQGSWPFHLRVWIDLARGLPRRTDLLAENMETSLRVDNLVADPALPEATFRLDPPPGAEVFDAREGTRP